jgi:hypothetical protein
MKRRFPVNTFGENTLSAERARAFTTDYIRLVEQFKTMAHGKWCQGIFQLQVYDSH